MGTKKLAAIWQIIRHDNAIVVTVDNDGNALSTGYGSGDLERMFTVILSVKAVYNNMLDSLQLSAAEQGELHALESLRAAIQKLERIE